MKKKIEVKHKKISTFLMGVLALILCLTVACGSVAQTCPPPPGTGPGAVYLGMASTYAVLGASTVTSTGPTIVNGDLGVWPGTAYVAGTPPATVNGSVNAGDVIAQSAEASLAVAFADAAGRTTNPIDVSAADLGGRTLAPGLYKSASTIGITGTLTLDGPGVYIFQVGSALTVNTGAQVVLANGATAANVFWQIGSSATIGTMSSFKGTIMAYASITLVSGAKLEGRALALHAAVTLDSNNVTIPLQNAVLVALPPSLVLRARD